MDYVKFYGMEAEPFRNEPDRRFYFEGNAPSQARIRLLRGLWQCKGLCVLVGGPGCGKTTLARHLLDSLNGKNRTVRLLAIPHSACDAGWVLPRIAAAFGVTRPATGAMGLLGQIMEQFARIKAAGSHPVLFIDEAQMLRNRDVMEEFRGLLNLEHKGAKLLSLVLLGLPELSEVLHLDEALAQRIDIRIQLGVLDDNDTAEYIKHRLSCVGGAPGLFSGDAIEAIHRYSRGVPRMINTLCDNALFEAYLARHKSIDLPLVTQVARDLDLVPRENAEQSAAPQAEPAEPERDPIHELAAEGIAMHDSAMPDEAEHDVLMQELSGQPAPDHDMLLQELPSQPASPHDMLLQEVQGQSALQQEVPMQEQPVQPAPQQAVPMQEQPMQPAPQQAVPAREQPMQPAPQQAVPVQQQPVQPAPQQAVPMQQQPVQPAPQQAVPMQEQPVQPAPQQAVPMQPAPQQAVPMQQQPMQPAPQRAVPVQEQPMQPAPQRAVPMQEQPMQPAPQRAVPMQEQPMQPTPQQAVPSQPAPQQAIPMQELPSQPVPQQVAPVQEAPSQPAPQREVPMQEAVPEQELLLQDETQQVALENDPLMLELPPAAPQAVQPQMQGVSAPAPSPQAVAPSPGAAVAQGEAQPAGGADAWAPPRKPSAPLAASEADFDSAPATQVWGSPALERDEPELGFSEADQELSLEGAEQLAESTPEPTPEPKEPPTLSSLSDGPDPDGETSDTLAGLVMEMDEDWKSQPPQPRRQPQASPQPQAAPQPQVSPQARPQASPRPQPQATQQAAAQPQSSDLVDTLFDEIQLDD
jgi:type II secretory pathway predicted ATPase ExeA